MILEKLPVIEKDAYLWMESVKNISFTTTHRGSISHFCSLSLFTLKKNPLQNLELDMVKQKAQIYTQKETEGVGAVRSRVVKRGTQHLLEDKIRARHFMCGIS